MQNVFYSKIKQIGDRILLAMILIIDLLCVVCLVVVVSAPEELPVIVAIILAVTELAYGAISVLLVFFVAIETRKYKVDENGITLCYFSSIYSFYPWSDVTEISVCDVEHSTGGSLRYYLVIRILRGTENKNQVSLISLTTRYETWRESLVYWVKHFRKVFMIQFTQERLEEIRAASGMEILDYRTDDAKLGRGKILT